MNIFYSRLLFLLISLYFFCVVCIGNERHCNTKTIYVLAQDNRPLDKYDYNLTTIKEAVELIVSCNDSIPFKIVLGRGVHYLDKSLLLSKLRHPLTIEALDKGKSILTSGIRIPIGDIKQEDKDIISIVSESEVNLLKINGRFVTMSCSVDQTNPSNMRQFSHFKKEKGNTYSATFDKDEIDKIEIGSYIFIYCKWIQYKLKVLQIDSVANRVVMGGRYVKVPYIVNDPNVYYAIYNSRKLLKPSSFCQINNKIYYRLGKNEDANNISWEIPTLSNLIKISDCNKDLRLKGIKFEGCIYNIWEEEVQGRANSTSAISINKSENVIIEDCEFYSNMGYSIKIANNSSNCIIKGNYLHDLQGGGIIIGDYDYRKTDITNRILIDNNLIKSFGRINASSEGVLVTKANHITITNNTICDGYYTGISLGWTWGYAKSHSYGNYVANNHIHHLMQCVLSDGAGIYTLGIQDNTVIENNYIHDIISRAFSAAGSSLLYFDEGTSNVIARNNVCFGSHSGFHEHYGKNNLVENNIFAYTNLVSVRLSNLAKDSNLTIKENTLIVDCGIAYNAALIQKSNLIDNMGWDKTYIDAKTGLQQQNSPINIKLCIKQLHDKGYLKNKFSYGVTSKFLKRKAVLSSDFLNTHNQMVIENFSSHSAYFKRTY